MSDSAWPRNAHDRRRATQGEQAASAHPVPRSSDVLLSVPLLSRCGGLLSAAGCTDHRKTHQLKTCGELLADARQDVLAAISDFDGWSDRGDCATISISVFDRCNGKLPYSLVKKRLILLLEDK
jgi:hypothetical protein